MRGFAGFFTFPDPAADPAGLLARLGNTLPGPLVLDDGRAALSGTRLVRSDDGALALAFDGTIYNRAELPPCPGGDESVVLALYAQHGAAGLELLRGPFALALWDGARDTGLLARDQMGLRALYYFHDVPNGCLAFATGVRPLMASGMVPRALDARGLYGFFRHGAVPEPVTMVSGIHALAPGGRLSWQAGHTTVARPDRPRPTFFPSGNPDPSKILRAALLDSVDQHLADGTEGAVFVGGGLASAALLALAREVGREKNLRALTLGFDDASHDEAALARRTAAHFGVPQTHRQLDATRAREWFGEYLPALDQPGVHGFPLFALCRLAREEGVAVAWSGHGLGELFGDAVLHARLRALMAGKRGFIGSLLDRWRPPTPMLADFLSRPPTLPGAYAAVRGVHTAEETRALVARFMDPTGCADPGPEDGPDDFPTVGDQINALERRRLLRDQFLRQIDTFSRVQGLDLRLPFVDARVAEAIARIPGRDRAEGYRQIIRRALPELPPWIPAPTASAGLRFPAAAWQAEQWGVAKPADGAGPRRRPRTWEQRWSLFLFRRWWRQFAAD